MSSPEPSAVENRTRHASIPARVAFTVLGVFVFLIAGAGLPLKRPYVGSAIACAYVLYLTSRRTLSEKLIVTIAGVICIEFHLYFWFSRFSVPDLKGLGAGLGFATFVVLTLRAIWSDDTARSEIRGILLPAAVLVLLLFGQQNTLNITGMLRTRALDLYLYSFDGSLGFQPSFLIGKLFFKYGWLRYFSLKVYYSILIAMTLSYGLHLRRKENEYRMLELFFTSIILGYILYNVFPAAGPAYAFAGEFPFGGLSFRDTIRLFVEPIPLAPSIFRNAMPSLHMSWVLLILWNFNSWPRYVRWPAFIYVVGTFLGTLGSGEHYLIDLIVAFPFTLMVQAICTRTLTQHRSTRVAIALAGFTTTLFWLVLLYFGNRLFWISPAVGWTLIAVTMSASLYGLRRLRCVAATTLPSRCESDEPRPQLTVAN